MLISHFSNASMFTENNLMLKFTFHMILNRQPKL